MVADKFCQKTFLDVQMKGLQSLSSGGSTDIVAAAASSFLSSKTPGNSCEQKFPIILR